MGEGDVGDISSEFMDRILLLEREEMKPDIVIVNNTWVDGRWPWHVVLDLNMTGYTIQRCLTKEAAEAFVSQFMADWEEEMKQ